MKHHSELIYLIKQMIHLRGQVNGHESPIDIDFERLDERIIPDINVLNELLSDLAAERVPVEGESSREAVIGSVESLGESKVRVYGSSTEKLRNFLKKIGGSDAAKKKLLPTVHLPHGVAWERIRMVVNELQEVYVFYRDDEGREGRWHKIDFEDLGMVGQGKKKPGRLWWAFQGIAQNAGVYEYTARDEVLRRKNKTALTRLLQQRFEMSDDPFETIGDRRYKTKFLVEYLPEFPADMGLR